jgi:hypothetical protein
MARMCDLACMTLKSIVFGQLMVVIFSSIASGMSLLQVLQSWLENDPSFWAQLLPFPILLFIMIFYSRKILRAVS